MKTKLIFQLTILLLIMISINACKTKTQIPKSTVTEQKDGSTYEEKTEHGIIMAGTLDETGTKIIMVPYMWWGAYGRADDKDAARVNAEVSARATISRYFNSIIEQKLDDARVQNNEETSAPVKRAIKDKWSLISQSIQKEIGPIPDVSYEYVQKNGVYQCHAKVGLAGTKYKKILNESTNFNHGLSSKEDIDEFLKINKAIFDAVNQ